jgi:hypothetical protein
MRDPKLSLVKLLEKRKTPLHDWIEAQNIKTYAEFLAKIETENLAVPEIILNAAWTLLSPKQEELKVVPNAEDPAPVNLEPEQPRLAKAPVKKSRS